VNAGRFGHPHRWTSRTIASQISSVTLPLLSRGGMKHRIDLKFALIEQPPAVGGRIKVRLPIEHCSDGATLQRECVAGMQLC
jgi:hypothetical protein